ncbi:MAG: serine hydrolase, partial [Bacteroidota bacterium]
KLNFLSLLLVLTCFSCKNEAQNNSTLTDKAYFTNVDLKTSQVTNDQHIELYNFYQDQFLSLHFTLDKPLVQSLKELAPNLTEDELLANGNYQFTFIVDGKTIYVENLNTGAGTKSQKTEDLNVDVRLVTPEQIDFWGWFMWQKFIRLHGGLDAFNEGIHNFSIEIRPYIQNDDLIVGDLLAKGTIKVEVPPIEVDEKLISIQPIKPNSGWEVSNDSLDRSQIEKLNRRIAEAAFHGIELNSVVIIKDNKLLIEEYFNGEDRNSLHDVRSVGKSFASTMLGVAIDEKLIKSEYSLLKEFYDLPSFENYTTKKDSVSLKSLLTMTSGFLGNDWDYSSPGNEENMYPTDNWVKFALDLPMDPDLVIDKDYSYFTAGAVILGDIVHQSVPGGLVSYADEKLFSPLEITDYQWQYTPQNVGNTAGGIRLRAIDFAKYGQLYKNKGQWNAKQILNPKWVEKSLGKQVSQANAGIEDGFYGYLFWNKVHKVNDKDYEVAFCSGNGGNKILIFKDIPFVIVITSSAYGMPRAHKIVDELMVENILPAILSQD